MSLDLKFNFVCAQRFAELEGADARVRFCGDCGEVHNLDAMLPWERAVLVKDAAASRAGCASPPQPR